MDVEDNNVINRAAAGETLELDLWPALQIEILARLEKIAHSEFPIPDLPPPRTLRRSLNNGGASSSSPIAEPSSQEVDKENAPIPNDGKTGYDVKKADEVDQEATATGNDKDVVMDRTSEASTEKLDGETSTATKAHVEAASGNAASESRPPDDGGSDNTNPPKLPVQLAAMLSEIKSHIQTFTHAPPHTLQRLAELVLQPCLHYRALATYLHAVDRVVQVTSGLNTYPLPPAIPDMSSMHINGVDGSKGAASSVNWGNPTVGAHSAANIYHAPPAPVGSDEALGGALLTPIPWLTRRSPESGDAASTSSGGGSTAGGSSSGAQIHSEGTETIDGPNGMGSIETVSVSVNGVPSTGHARGVTQGELLRQEQRAGVVPVSQLSRNAGHPQHAMQHHQLQSQREAGAHGDGFDGSDEDEPPSIDEDRRAPAVDDGEEEEAEDELPHARGPDEIGVGDTGLQTATTSAMGEAGLEMQGIDVAAAVGRPREEEEHPAQRKSSPENEQTVEKQAKVEDEEAPLSPESVATKREAEDTAQREPAKKLKEE
ncbi:hypothetical protein CCM_00070 [Cordyceps militaris CM01]|uniref:Protein phosphatase 4 core regulatory subunit R2 n=1 Tax=Cordyceps militaris (strain CM01) TaxID=983644 RepID=G3J6T8_CORMM|nr:uncharacterized protein CCM_00070 [Cordyceps militaris CM01]EGX95416.1 hypothetical protein CCM_00070 [Cordyceps militaris CM01]